MNDRAEPKDLADLPADKCSTLLFIRRILCSIKPKIQDELLQYVDYNTVYEVRKAI